MEDEIVENYGVYERKRLILMGANCNAGFVHETQPKEADPRVSFSCIFKVTVDDVHKLSLRKREGKRFRFFSTVC